MAGTGAGWNFDKKVNYIGLITGVGKAQIRGINLKYGSDAFAQIVLILEDPSRRPVQPVVKRLPANVYPEAKKIDFNKLRV